MDFLLCQLDNYFIKSGDLFKIFNFRDPFLELLETFLLFWRLTWKDIHSVGGALSTFPVSSLK